MPSLFMDQPKSISYEEYRKVRPRPIGELAQQVTGPSVEPATKPPVPQALASLDEHIEDLGKALAVLDDKLRPASTAILPEAGVSGAQLTQGNSEFARRIYDARDHVGNLVCQVQRMINNLEI